MSTFVFRRAVAFPPLVGRTHPGRTPRRRVAHYLIASSILVFGAVSCGGSDGGVSGLDDLFPSFGPGHSLTTDPGEEYTIGEAVNVTLPGATGGNPPLTYSVTPTLPAGLSFNAAGRTISGTPTTPQPRTQYEYTVTDADTFTIRFGITVAAGTTSAGTCRVGQVLGPGESCTVGSDRFEVRPNGRGRMGFITPDPAFLCQNAGSGLNCHSSSSPWRSI